MAGICLDLHDHAHHSADKTADPRGLWKPKPASSCALRLSRLQLVDSRAHPLPLTTNLRDLAARMAQGEKFRSRGIPPDLPLAALILARHVQLLQMISPDETLKRAQVSAQCCR